MFDDEVREQIFAKSELQKIDLMTLSLVIKAIEEVLEEADNEQSLSGTYKTSWHCGNVRPDTCHSFYVAVNIGHSPSGKARKGLIER